MKLNKIQIKCFYAFQFPERPAALCFVVAGAHRAHRATQGYRTNGIFISQSLLYIFQPGGIMTWQAGGQDGTLTDLLK